MFGSLTNYHLFIIVVKDISLTAGGSASEPVSVTELKEYLQLEGTAFDSVLSAFITSARAAIESTIGVSLIEKDAVAWMELCGAEQVPYYPVVSIASVEYTDDGGQTWVTLTEFDDYIIIGTDRQTIESNRPGLHRLTYDLGAGAYPDLVASVKAQAGYMWTHRDSATVSGLSPVVAVMIKPYILAY